LILLVIVVGIAAVLGYRSFNPVKSPADQAVTEQLPVAESSADQSDVLPQARSEEASDKSGMKTKSKPIRRPAKPSASWSAESPEPPSAELSDEPPAPPVASSAQPAMTPTTALRTAEQHLQRGREHFNAGRYHQSLEEYQQVKRLDANNQDVGYLMGLAYEQMGQLEAALEAYRGCTSGPYAGVAGNHVKRLEKKLRRSK
jgi:tetratricopeptide (TPR) repeat protein